MRYTDAIIIGAGQSGLAMSHCLSRSSIEHVVLERGQVAQRWRDERWDSLRLLTPNWMSRLPGWCYQGADPDGFMTMPEVITYLEGYAQASRAPIIGDTTVHAVQRVPGGYRIESNRGTWIARAVVIATGHCDTPLIPAMAQEVPALIQQIAPSNYRSPEGLPEGPVLIVGASATGVQLAEEVHQSGRPVTLAVGRHTRLPRLYRGQDIMWWMDQIGVLTEHADHMANLARARMQPSMQLAGRPDRSNLDLRILHDLGVRIVGRVANIQEGVVHLRDDLGDSVMAAQGKMERLLARIDRIAGAMHAPAESWPTPPMLPAPIQTTLDLHRHGIRTIIWATGFRRNYQWLHAPVLDVAGEIIHVGGVTPSPGLYVLGIRFLRRRNSSFLDGVGADAAELAGDIIHFLDGIVCAAA